MKPSALLLIALCATASTASAETYPSWPIVVAPGDQTNPRHAAWRVFWMDGRDTTGADLYMSAERYGTPESFVAAPQWQYDFRTAPDDFPYSGCESGGHPIPGFTALSSMVVWVDGRSGDLDLRVKPDGMGQGWPAVDTPLCSAPGFQTDPRIVLAAHTPYSDSSSWIAAWLDRRNGTDRHVYAQRLRSVVSTVTPEWAADGVPVCTVPGFCSDLGLVADGSGGAYLVWTQEAGGIRVQRITDAGIPAPGWPVNGLPVSGATAATAAQPRIVKDGGDGVLIAWNDLRATEQPADADIYAQHLTGSGAVANGWPVDGLPVTTAFQDQWIAGVETDNSGGAIVVWEDGRNRFYEELSPNYDIRALRITGSGAVAPGWNTDGTVVCDRPFAQSNAAAINDGGSGVYIAWEDRDGPELAPDIRASHLEGNGQLPITWPAGGEDGVVICDVAGAQTTPSVGYMCHFLLVAWVDERNAATTGKDIYAVSMSPFGRVDVGDIRPAALALGAPRPNPARMASATRIDLPEPGTVEASIADLAGRRVATLVGGERWEAGTHELRWDGRDAAGAPVRAGVYFLHVRTGASSAVRRIVLMR